MKTLLLDFDPQHAEYWLKRLEAVGAEVHLISSDQQWRQQIARHQFALSLCRLPLLDRDLHVASRRLREVSAAAVAIATDNDKELHKQAYLGGFDDCIDYNCDDAEVLSKLEHAVHLHQIDRRLIQAQKLESIGELAAGIAHEINTPIQYVGDNTRFVRDACEDLNRVLAACKEVVQLLETGQNPAASVVKLRESMQNADIEYLTEEIPTAIGQTLDGVDRVANIVRAMKEFAHPGNSKTARVDLKHLIESTITVARNEWKYVAALETNFDTDMPDVTCYPGELNQVMLNMIVNAAHAIGDTRGTTPESKGVIQIETQRDGDYAEIRIRDNGCGVSDIDRERIFEPFYTTKPAGKGTGQGLAIAREVIVEKHGGMIRVESESGKGTTFFIRIPVDQNDARERLAQENSETKCVGEQS